uniref:Uncharacterized protein n=1 Tax=Rhizophora mucronata TaxID=61149 RepID=A0A2P2PTN4_RHIMU
MKQEWNKKRQLQS